MNFGKQLKEGLITQNPVLVQVLGMCSTMAITTSFFNGLGMGVSVLIILTLSNIFISLLRKIIPNEVRIACYIVVIAGFVTCVDLLLKAFVPALSSSLGVFIPLIVVNCIILGRAEGFASKNGVGASAVDGICQGIGYTLVLIVMCVVREFLGSGKFGGGLLGGGALGSAPGVTIIPEEFGIKVLTLPVGGFLTLGCLIALMQWALAKSAKKKEGKYVMSVTTLLAISLGAILTNNFIFAQFLGICPFLGVSKKIDTAVGMGAAVTFVMGLASAVCFGVNKILVAMGLGYMQTVAFILVIAGLVQFVEMFLKKNIPTLYTALGVYLPLITTNCAVLGVALLNVQNDYSFIGSVVYGITGGLGFLLAIFLFAAVREQLEVSSENPKAFDGFPIALVTAGLMALAFMGFSGLKVW